MPEFRIQPVLFKLLPLLIFFALVGFLAKGLTLDPGQLPSPLVDKPVPVFSLPTFSPEQGDFSATDLAGEVWLLNVWSSWCGPCIQEHPLIVDLAKTQDIPIVGLNYKDSATDSQAWLTRYGNPFYRVLADRDGRVGIDWGVYGVPETFVIDGEGRVRYKHVGPLTEEALDKTVVPLLQELRAQANGTAS